MTITNGYCTLQELKDLKRITSTDATDDAVIEKLIEDASRMIDAVCGRWFYAATQTRRFDVPDSSVLRFDEDLLSITTLTNGDGATIASTEYVFKPANSYPKYLLMLLPTSTVTWQLTSAGNELQAISVAGSWGYVDRTAIDARSVRVINNTRRACLEIAHMKYQQRMGQNVTGSVVVTPSGVVQTPEGAMPKAAYDAIEPYVRLFG